MTAAILYLITALLCVVTVNEACKCAVVHPQTNFCNADFGKILYSVVYFPISYDLSGDSCPFSVIPFLVCMSLPCLRAWGRLSISRFKFSRNSRD